jgi:hypothetical protein
MFIAMPRRVVLSVPLLCSLSLIRTLAQAPNANPGFEVKEGLWDLTQTTYTIVPMPDDWLDKLIPQPTPEQRAEILAAQKDPRSHTAVEKRTICLTRERLDQADITRHSLPCTKIQFASTGTSITRHTECQGITEEAQFERSDAETFKGTQISFVTDDPAQFEGHMEIAAKWAGADCVGIKKSRAYAAGLAAGIDPDVLSFLPFKLLHSDDGPVIMGKFGPFKYFWKPTGGVPSLVYHGGIPDAPEDARSTWFAGTDGDFLYTVLHQGQDPCGDAAASFRFDHSGAATRIDQIPDNLRGGKGAPPCK